MCLVDYCLVTVTVFTYVSTVGTAMGARFARPRFRVSSQAPVVIMVLALERSEGNRSCFAGVDTPCLEHCISSLVDLLVLAWVSISTAWW